MQTTTSPTCQVVYEHTQDNVSLEEETELSDSTVSGPVTSVAVKEASGVMSAFSSEHCEVSALSAMF